MNLVEVVLLQMILEIKNGLLALFLLGQFTACSQEAVKPGRFYFSSPPSELSDSIKTGSLANAGIDSNIITALTDQILADSFHNVHSVLIVKDNKLVYENYFAGKDQHHGRKLGVIGHYTDQLHDCRSISKSIVAACIGIAIKNKLITSIDDPIGEYLEMVKNSPKGKITIKNLLTMTAGLDWEEIGHYSSFFNSENQMDLRFNPIKYILRKSQVEQPGITWHYSGGNTQLLAEIIKKVSGLNVYQYAEKFLFSTLGIKQSEWVQLTLKATPAAASGLRLTSRDMAKFGMLYLNKGNWLGKQIIDTSWIEQSFTPCVERTDLTKYKIKDGSYGYSFWLYTDTCKNRPVEIIEAKGNGGQSIFICRQYKLILITTGGNYNSSDDNGYLMLTKYVLPALK